MSEIYQVTITHQDGREFKGKMSRRQPEIVNGFIALATESGQWIYIPPTEVKLMVFEPEPDTEQPAAEEPLKTDSDKPSETQNAPTEEKGDEQEEGNGNDESM